VRNALVAALASYTGSRQRSQSLRFLQGLSGDELQYIAEFLGSCILESTEGLPTNRARLAEQVVYYGRSRHCRPAALDDQDHKTILLLEFLYRGGLRLLAMPAHTPRTA